MNAMLRMATVAFAMLVGSPVALRAETPPAVASTPNIAMAAPSQAETSHALNIRGRILQYRARAGSLAVSNGAGGASAEWHPLDGREVSQVGVLLRSIKPAERTDPETATPGAIFAEFPLHLQRNGLPQ
jgi:hypothetical protein